MTTWTPNTEQQMACPKHEHEAKHYWSDGTCRCVHSDDPGWEDCPTYKRSCKVPTHLTHRLDGSRIVWQGLRS